MPAPSAPIATTDAGPPPAPRLAVAGFDFVLGTRLLAEAAARGGTGWDGFAASWDALEPDRFMADGGTYRKRRFACFGMTAAGVRRKPARPHYQSRDHNPLNGGVARTFAPVTDAIAGHPMTGALLRLGAALFDAVRPARDWHVEMHQFRIEARPDAAGLPTPEGMHRDGVDFVLTMLVGRNNVKGGVSTIADGNRVPVAAAALAEPGDAYVIDDRRVMHGVSPVHPLDPARPAHRDVLVLTFRSEEN